MFKYKVGDVILKGLTDECVIEDLYVEDGRIWHYVRFLDGSAGSYLERDLVILEHCEFKGLRYQ